MSRLLISAAHKSSGKTTITVGICAALTQRGLRVQPFKKGPDYIDPMWLAQASGRACFNLDPYLMSHAQIEAIFATHSHHANISIVEGNKGLYDGLALDGSNSNAALAKLLDLPVVLVLDARGMTRGIAPLILGYQAFDPAIRIAGVILNKIGGSRHEAKLRAVIEHYTNVEVLGAIGHDAQLSVTERHLGLMPNHELDDAAQRVNTMGELIAKGVNLDRLLNVANQCVNPTPLEKVSIVASPSPTKKDLRIGIAQDKAFGFYYQDDLLAFENAGVELVPFDTMQDAALPDVDGIFIGGGFPEMFMPLLEGNVILRQRLHAAIEDGLPVYAECGGLMYLARSIHWQDKNYDMVGAIPADVQMHSKPIGRGYVELETTSNTPWALPGSAVETNTAIKGHEFHYSSLENIAPEMQYAYRVKRGHGADGKHDGLLYKNVLASYAHLHHNASSQWVEQFVAFVRDKKEGAYQMTLAEPVLTQTVLPDGRIIETDTEGYLKNLDDWSEDFARARAATEGLELKPEHWEVIRFLREYYEEHRVQAQVRVMIWHFSKVWDEQRGSNHNLHELFPIGGPQKQGNRLAGLLKTKGEH